MFQYVLKIKICIWLIWSGLHSTHVLSHHQWLLVIAFFIVWLVSIAKTFQTGFQKKKLTSHKETIDIVFPILLLFCSRIIMSSKSLKTNISNAMLVNLCYHGKSWRLVKNIIYLVFEEFCICAARFTVFKHRLIFLYPSFVYSKKISRSKEKNYYCSKIIFVKAIIRNNYSINVYSNCNLFERKLIMKIHYCNKMYK